MNINEEINRIKEYFLNFSINDGLGTVIVKFPSKWSLFNKSDIEKEFNVKIEPREQGIFFLCDMMDGFDNLFNSINYIIDNNKSLEEKTSLLEIKIKELSELFMSQPLEKLKTLEFTFPKKTSKTKKVEPLSNEKVFTLTAVEEESDSFIVRDDQHCHAEMVGDANCLVPNEIEKENTTPVKSKKKNKQKVEDSSLMDYAKTMIGEK